MDIREHAGERLREARLFRGWSQELLAKESGVHKDTISGIERGEHTPRPVTLRKLAEALELRVPDLLSGHYEAMTSAGKAPASAR